MLPSELGTEIGPGFRGVRALVVTGNRRVALLRWPFFFARKVRKSRVLARWIGPDYVRPVWGESPPPVCDAPKDEAARKAPLYGAAETSGPEVALQIAIDAGVLAVCPGCGVVYRQADADPASAYKLANAGFSRKLYPEFSDRRTLTDAVKAVIESAPDACECGAKPRTEDAPKKAGQAREQGLDRPVGAATKKPQQIMKPSVPQVQAKPTNERQPEAETDPFADIIGSALIDTIVPGASVVTDIISTITPDSADASDLPMIPGIPAHDADADDEIGSGRELEAGD